MGEGTQSLEDRCWRTLGTTAGHGGAGTVLGTAGANPKGIAARGETLQSLPAEPAAAPEPGKVCKRRSRGRPWASSCPKIACSTAQQRSAGDGAAHLPARSADVGQGNERLQPDHKTR